MPPTDPITKINDLPSIPADRLINITGYITSVIDTIHLDFNGFFGRRYAADAHLILADIINAVAKLNAFAEHVKRIEQNANQEPA